MTPSGTPAETKPTNSGTAEHEQNGVKIPRLAAATLPSPSRLPARKARVRSGEKKLRTMPMANTTSASSMSTLGVSKMKKLAASCRWLPGVIGIWATAQLENGSNCQYTANQAMRPRMVAPISFASPSV